MFKFSFSFVAIVFLNSAAFAVDKSPDYFSKNIFDRLGIEITDHINEIKIEEAYRIHRTALDAELELNPSDLRIQTKIEMLDEAYEILSDPVRLLEYFHNFRYEELSEKYENLREIGRSYLELRSKLDKLSISEKSTPLGLKASIRPRPIHPRIILGHGLMYGFLGASAVNLAALSYLSHYSFGYVAATYGLGISIGGMKALSRFQEERIKPKLANYLLNAETLAKSDGFVLGSAMGGCMVLLHMMANRGGLH
ncbi:MAG: hypothetical protein J0L93_03450 [Deltaproteobacteria bacterium]|nr:hypothetical protein [Deltaproteobacteria bacterium]